METTKTTQSRYVARKRQLLQNFDSSQYTSRNLFRWYTVVQAHIEQSMLPITD